VYLVYIYSISETRWRLN